MESKALYPDNTADILFIGVAVIAAGLGLYGLFIMASLSKTNGHVPHGQQVDKLMIGLFNITLSVVCLYIVILITQSNVNQLFTQTNKLLGQLK